MCNPTFSVLHNTVTVRACVWQQEHMGMGFITTLGQGVVLNSRLTLTLFPARSQSKHPLTSRKRLFNLLSLCDPNTSSRRQKHEQKKELKLKQHEGEQEVCLYDPDESEASDVPKGYHLTQKIVNGLPVTFLREGEGQNNLQVTASTVI